MTNEKIVHCKKEKYDVYIGRPSKWGNPFIIGTHGTRIEVIEKYRKYIFRKLELLDSLHELKGKILGCWCTPLLCHGSVLIELINKQEKDGSIIRHEKRQVICLNKTYYVSLSPIWVRANGICDRQTLDVDVKINSLIIKPIRNGGKLR